MWYRSNTARVLCPEEARLVPRREVASLNWDIVVAQAGGRSSTGILFGHITIKGLEEVLADVPICARWSEAEGYFDHLDDAPENDPSTTIGWVREARIHDEVVFATAELTDSPIEDFLLRAERRGVLVRGGPALSIWGVSIPPFDCGAGEPEYLFARVVSVDLVDRPGAGGYFLRSAEARAAGSDLPGFPRLKMPPPRPRTFHVPQPAFD